MTDEYKEYWLQKKRERKYDTAPFTPLDELMFRQGVTPDQIAPVCSQPVAPGQVIQAFLDERQITQAELAKIMHVSRTAIHLWIHSQRALSVENAIEFEQATGIPAHVLLRLQADFQLYSARHPEACPDPVPRHSTL